MALPANPSSKSQSHTAHNPAFDQALQSHLRQEQWFASSTPREVLDEVQQHVARYQQRSRLSRYVDRIRNIVEPMEQFFTAVDQGVSSNPAIGGIVWGCLRFIFLVGAACYSAETETDTRLFYAFDRLYATPPGILKRLLAFSR